MINLCYIMIILCLITCLIIYLIDYPKLKKIYDKYEMIKEIVRQHDFSSMDAIEEIIGEDLYES